MIAGGGALNRTGQRGGAAIVEKPPARTGLGELYAFAELFNEEGAFGLERYNSAGLKHLIERSGINFADERDPRLISFARAQPTTMLSQLTDMATQNSRTGVSFKVFPRAVSAI